MDDIVILLGIIIPTILTMYAFIDINTANDDDGFNYTLSRFAFTILHVYTVLADVMLHDKETSISHLMIFTTAFYISLAILFLNNDKPPKVLFRYMIAIILIYILILFSG